MCVLLLTFRFLKHFLVACSILLKVVIRLFVFAHDLFALIVTRRRFILRMRTISVCDFWRRVDWLILCPWNKIAAFIAIRCVLIFLAWKFTLGIYSQQSMLVPAFGVILDILKPISVVEVARESLVLLKDTICLLILHLNLSLSLIILTFRSALRFSMVWLIVYSSWWIFALQSEIHWLLGLVQRLPVLWWYQATWSDDVLHFVWPMTSISIARSPWISSQLI